MASMAAGEQLDDAGPPAAGDVGVEHDDVPACDGRSGRPPGSGGQLLGRRVGAVGVGEEDTSGSASMTYSAAELREAAGGGVDAVGDAHQPGEARTLADEGRPRSAEWSSSLSS